LINQSRFEVFVALNTLHPYCVKLPRSEASTNRTFALTTALVTIHYEWMIITNKISRLLAMVK